MALPRNNLRMRVAYDGRDFHGWQRLKDAPTVQGTLEAALREVCEAPVEVRGAGRTDRGAHARGQVANARVPAETGLDTLRERLPAALPSTVTVHDLAFVDASFHARTHATAKRYIYTIHNAPSLAQKQQGLVWHVPGALDVAAMAAVLPTFVGEHDFSSFATRSNFDRKSSVRTVSAFTLEQDGPRIALSITADGFLYKMVRNVVRAVVKVGEGRWSDADLKRILAARDRQAAPGTAPASGLTLDTVFYGQEWSG